MAPLNGNCVDTQQEKITIQNKAAAALYSNNKALGECQEKLNASEIVDFVGAKSLLQGE